MSKQEMTESQKKRLFIIILVANILGCAFLILGNFPFQFAAFWFGLCTAFDLIVTSTMNFLTDPAQKKTFKYSGIALLVATIIYIINFIFFQ